MKKILGLDLGTNSIGWAVVNEAENTEEKSSIVKLGVRVIPLTVDEQQNFEKGKSITTNADRTLKRSMRRNLQRYKLRREALIKILKENGFINDNTVLAETGNKTTFETYRLRAKAATEEVSLSEFARILLQINKKRGYKSSRKAKGTEEGTLIDGMDVAKQLYEDNLTPGQLCYQILQKDKKILPDFYPSDLRNEFDRIWDFQKQFHPFLTDTQKEALCGKNEKATWADCAPSKSGENDHLPWKWTDEQGNECVLVGEKRDGTTNEQKVENFKWRSQALTEKLKPEQLIVVFQKINGQINNASGYLGAISDCSKELYFKKMTVGQYQMDILKKNPHASLKNMVFYRQDYLDEFEKLWETQKQFHPELKKDELKHEIRDIVIFYQRRLKSQKGLISLCEFESKQIEIDINGIKKTKTVGSRVIPRSSPLFQEFKIWQILNNVEISLSGRKTNRQKQRNNTSLPLFDQTEDVDPMEIYGHRPLLEEEKELLAKELFVREKMSKKDALALLFDNSNELDMNFKTLDGNRTGYALYQAFGKIIEQSGHFPVDFTQSAEDIRQNVEDLFKGLGWNTDILDFDSSDNYEQQAFYQLWHLLYSFEGDNEKLVAKLMERYGFDKDSAQILANVVFLDDYGSLSAKAINKILPYLKDGSGYDKACVLAGYGRHSRDSLTREEIEQKVLKQHLDILPRNSLRNPVVEKILNQMVNVINPLVDAYGTPDDKGEKHFDEIRIELARELKKNQQEREDLSKEIHKNSKLHEKYREELSKPPFNLSYISRKDIIRYKLWNELAGNGHKTLYSNTYISPNEVFSDKFDIEHIIPQATLFDDSFSNKTLELCTVNREKGNKTAYDFVKEKYGENGLEEYKSRVERLYDAKKRTDTEDNNETTKAESISKSKYKKLLMTDADIPDGFIDRDLRNTQYIAKKAVEMLNEITRSVVPTTGSLTDRLREDWRLVDIMKELNWDKYSKLGLTKIVDDIRKDDQGRDKKYVIVDWTKRNDHRHHAMDALTVAFTKRALIQYFNNLNARIPKKCSCGYEKYTFDTQEYSDWTCPECGKKYFVLKDTAAVYGIEQKELYRNSKGKLLVKAPFELDEFRAEAMRQLNKILVSIKAKNKVVTPNINKTKKNGGTHTKVQLTPRGQLHDESIYGSQKRYKTKEVAVGSKFDSQMIATVANPKERNALMKRLQAFGGDPKKAFTGKNSLEKNPLFLNEAKTLKCPGKVKVVSLETVYTIRKPIDKDLKVDKVLDQGIKRILEKRLAEKGGNAQEAFSNLEGNPIWLNKAKGIAIKRVTITSIRNAEALHSKHNHLGKPILDEQGKPQAADFVNTGNNHHVAIYKAPVLDKEGQPVFDDDDKPKFELQEKIVSFYEATARANQGLPIIDKTYKQDEGWEFLFTMKQNEYFVFPRYEKVDGEESERMVFDPAEIDLLNPDNYAQISPNLFRVQRISSKDYTFRHHLETSVTHDIKDETFKRISNLIWLQNIIKIRVNHIGQIVQTGEY